MEIINLKIADSLQHSDAQKIWYTGKTMQAEVLEKKSTDEVHLVDTSLYPVSGLNIRNDALRYFNAIALPFRRAFTKKVLVLGAPSGKRRWSGFSETIFLSLQFRIFTPVSRGIECE